MSFKTQAFWQEYLCSLPIPNDASERFYETFHIGDSEASADHGAELIKQGIKIATSSLLWEYQAANKPLPKVGSLSILENGRGEPVCVVETTWLEIKNFNEIDVQFAYDYGEWDRTLKTWHQECWEYYSEQCYSLGREPTKEMPLVCERFRVVYP
ncbi:ASCH domain-containing protein [Fischerella thermalis]|uniref:ASCH domain-containing protein n=1 Tax=Fischerella thermalis TaxID=372787 RepID=UPI0015E0D72C|nr:ASCH domain-containing protein [Fischerella thermalis]